MAFFQSEEIIMQYVNDKAVCKNKDIFRLRPNGKGLNKYCVCLMNVDESLLLKAIFTIFTDIYYIYNKLRFLSSLNIFF